MNSIAINYFMILFTSCLYSFNVAEDVFASDMNKKILKLAKSAQIQAYMNQKINPCDDFYTYACSKWRFHNPAQINGHLNTNQFQQLAMGMDHKLNNLLLSKRNGNDGEIEKMKDFYDSCLEIKADTEKYRSSLIKLYKEIGEFSSFKTLEQIRETNFKWWSTVANIQKKYGKSIILSQQTLNDVEDESKPKFYIGPPKDMLQNVQEKNIQKYMHSHLNIVPEDAQIMAKKALTFESKLNAIETDVRFGKHLEELLTLYNINDLVEKYQHLFDVKEYLEIVLDMKELPTQIYVYNESYFEGLNDILNSTELEVVEDYILWTFLEEFMIDIISSNMKKECLDRTKKYFGNYIDHIIYKKYRSNESEAEIYELWDDIKTTFRHNLENDRYYWLQNVTRDEAIKKLNNMNLTINSYDHVNFIEIFKNIDIDRTNYVLNVQNILQHAESLRDNQLVSLTPVYNILENQIKIPVALMQPRHIWDPIYPKAIQYGSLGYLIAHEMIHGFDEEGRKYDASGNVQEWWDEKSLYEYESRRKCYEDQYLKYNYGFKSLPKFVKNGGINIAFDAYKRWLSKQNLSDSDVEANETLPRLSLNNHQLFFLSFSQLWCEEIHSMFRSTFFNGGVQASGKYRVISSLANSREFSWQFKCDENSKMNPAMKCEIY